MSGAVTGSGDHSISGRGAEQRGHSPAGSDHAAARVSADVAVAGMTTGDVVKANTRANPTNQILDGHGLWYGRSRGRSGGG